MSTPERESIARDIVVAVLAHMPRTPGTGNVEFIATMAAKAYTTIINAICAGETG